MSDINFTNRFEYRQRIEIDLERTLAEENFTYFSKEPDIQQRNYLRESILIKDGLISGEIMRHNISSSNFQIDSG